MNWMRKKQTEDRGRECTEKKIANLKIIYDLDHNVNKTKWKIVCMEWSVYLFEILARWKVKKSDWFSMKIECDSEEEEK